MNGFELILFDSRLLESVIESNAQITDTTVSLSTAGLCLIESVLQSINSFAFVKQLLL